MERNYFKWLIKNPWYYLIVFADSVINFLSSEGKVLLSIPFFIGQVIWFAFMIGILFLLFRFIYIKGYDKGIIK